jgi:integrase
VAEIPENPRLESITASDFDALTVKMISNGYAALYARHHFSALRTALRQARRWGLIAGRPWEDARAPVAPRSRPKVATMDESRKLSAYVRARNRPVVAAYVDFLAGTGARPGEALALKWDRVDLVRGEVTLDRSVECHMPGHYRLAEAVKTGRGRTVRITGALIAILTDLAAWHDDLAQKSGGRWPARPDGLVFPSTMGDLWNPDAAARVIRRAADGAKVTGGSYSRRHGMATELLLAGAPVSLVSARLGHASAKMTLDVYAHLLPGAEDQVLDILEAKGL